MKTPLPLALMLSISASLAHAACPAPSDSATELGHARLYIEDNAADGDIGVHGSFDDHAWRVLCVFAPDGSEIFSVEPKGKVGELGVASIFFESNEPEYEDFNYDDLVAAFPEGTYIARGEATDGTPLIGEARFSTIVPLPPEILTPATTQDEDSDLPLADPSNLTVSWTPTTQSRDGRPVTISGYQVILVNESYEGNNDSFATPIYDVRVGPGVTNLPVPPEFLEPDTVYELEIIAIEDSGNQTIAGASFFRTP